MIGLLAVVAFIVGILIGSVGVGGILLIPALKVFAHLSIHMAMSTALFSFIFTGIAGTCMFQRRGSINWRVAIPVCLGAAFFGYPGALFNSKVNAVLLNFILSLIIIFAGISILRPAKSRSTGYLIGNSMVQKIMLFGIGAVAGFCSGLTGVGGPVLSVPMMIIIGFAPLSAIAASQVIQIVAAISGTIGNLAYGAVDFYVGAIVTIVEFAGVLIGVHIAHSAKTHQLINIVGFSCILVGGMIFIRSSGIVGIMRSYFTA